MIRYLENIKQKHPLVHCITNYVVMNDSANALLAIHASPIMTNDEYEVEDVTKVADSLVLNLGTMNHHNEEAMIKAGIVATKRNIPVILDPVGVGGSPYRRKVVQRMLESIQFSVIKGNPNEIKTLCGFVSGKGVDSEEADASIIELGRKLAMQTNAIIVVSGKTDYIITKDQYILCHHGCEMMSRVTGTGCMLGAMLGAFACTNQDCLLEAIVYAIGYYGKCGELAYQKVLETSTGTGSFHMYLLDYISQVENEVDVNCIQWMKF